MKIEDWVPEEALVAWNMARSRLEDDVEYTTMLISGYEKMRDRNGRLTKIEKIEKAKLRLNRIKSALENIPKLFISFENGPEPREFWENVKDQESYSITSFIVSVVESYVGPTLATEVMTKGMRTKWRAEVERSASKLIEIVGDTRLNNILEQKYFELESEVLRLVDISGVDISTEFKESLRSVFIHPPLLTTILHELIYADEKEIRDWIELHYETKSSYVEMSKSGDSKAYFIRRMTHFFGERTGSPRRELVKTLVRCLFGGLEESNIARIAPWKKDN